MSRTPVALLADGRLDLTLLQRLSEPPAPFEPGEPRFWNDPHISAGMLETHLDPDTDLASRKPETIDATASWIIAELGLSPGDRVLDLGCGPGLYCTRFARAGMTVTGVDFSDRSIAYARERAAEDGLDITYHVQDYTSLALEEQFDAVLLIYLDFCVLAPAERDRLLDNVARVLKPGGRFVLDITTKALLETLSGRSSWSAVAEGFWLPEPHLLLEHQFVYPERSLFCNQYAAVTADGELRVWRIWHQGYSVEGVTRLFDNHGLAIESTWGNLTGAPYEEGSAVLGVVAGKTG